MYNKKLTFWFLIVNFRYDLEIVQKKKNKDSKVKSE